MTYQLLLKPAAIFYINAINEHILPVIIQHIRLRTSYYLFMTEFSRQQDKCQVPINRPMSSIFKVFERKSFMILLNETIYGSTQYYVSFYWQLPCSSKAFLHKVCMSNSAVTPYRASLSHLNSHIFMSKCIIPYIHAITSTSI